ncbi:hypothetical protein EsHS_00007305 [Epichloe bromicola]
MCSTTTEPDLENRSEVLTKMSWYMLMIGEYSRAEKVAKEAVRIRQTAMGLDHPSTLTSMANLASTYCNQGRWEEAEGLEVQVMETRKTKLGADHPDTLTSMANLAHTYWSQDRRTEAADLMRRCVEAQKGKLGAEHPDYRNNYRILIRWKSELGDAEV